MLEFLQSYQKRSSGKNTQYPLSGKPPITSLRRRVKDTNKAPNATLKHILGLTTAQNSAFAVHPSQDIIAYAAGCVVVLYNYRKNKQIGFLQAIGAAVHQLNTSTENSKLGFGVSITPTLNSSASQSKIPLNYAPKAISCLTFSPDGNLLAVGESGYQPRVLIWDWRLLTIVSELLGHKFGVSTVSFSPDMKCLVSIGFQHDGFLYAWDWRTGMKLASNKISSKVSALTFANGGSYCITAGLRHIKYWYFDGHENSNTSTTKVMIGRSGILSSLSNNTFVDIACGKDDSGGDIMYCITASGLLCQFSEGRVIQKWINLQVKKAFSICADDKYIVCGCENGIIRLFEPITLKYLGTLPRPHQLDVDVTSPGYQPNAEGVYPNTIAVRLTYNSEKIACIYSDRSMFIWDIKNLERVGKYRSFLYHSDCVWNVETYPETINTPDSLGAYIPSDSFATCSSDGTIRFWNLEHLYAPSSVTSPVVSPTSPGSITSYRGNIYSRELLSMLVINQYQPMISENSEDWGEVTSTVPKIHSSRAIRSIRISPDGRYLASGDKEGNLRIYDLLSMEQVVYQEAHNGDILTIDFSDPSTTGLPFMVATAGRDRLIHIFDANNSFTPIQTLDDHSAAITSLRFSGGGGILISCSADKSIIFRKAMQQLEVPFFVSYQNHCAKASVYDMDLDSTKPVIASVTQDKRFHLFGIESGKVEKSHRPESLDESSPDTNILKISLDPSGSFVATCCSDKSIRIFDVLNGNLIAKLYGHSEQVTSIKFSQDCTRVISAAGDGCIFIWSLSPTVTKQILRNRRLLSSPDDDCLSEKSGNDLRNGIRPSSSKGLVKVRSMENVKQSQDISRVKDLNTVIDPRRIGSIPRRKVSECREDSGSRIRNIEGNSKMNHRLNFPGINYTLDSSNIACAPEVDMALVKGANPSSQSSTDDEDLTVVDMAESSEDEGCDEIIYLEPAENKSPTSATYEFTVEENKPTGLDQNLTDEEVLDENAILGVEFVESEENESSEYSGEFLEDLFELTQESADLKNDCQRQSMSARFLSSSTVTLKSILENIPEHDHIETNVVEAHAKLCGSPNSISPTSPVQKTPFRHWRKRSCSLDFPIDTSDTFQIMTPPRRNRTDQELEHPRRTLRNAGLLSANTSKKENSMRSLSPILSPRTRHITPRRLSNASHEPVRPNKETKDTERKADTTRSLQALSKILHLQRSLSQALESHQYLFQSLQGSSSEDDLSKQVCRGLNNLRIQIDSTVPKQKIESSTLSTTSNVLGVLVENESTHTKMYCKSNSRIDSNEIGAVESKPNSIDNTQKPENTTSTPLMVKQPEFADMLEKYSDLLLKMVEEKMERSKGPPPSETAARVPPHSSPLESTPQNH